MHRSLVTSVERCVRRAEVLGERVHVAPRLRGVVGPPSSRSSLPRDRTIFSFTGSTHAVDVLI